MKSSLYTLYGTQTLYLPIGFDGHYGGISKSSGDFWTFGTDEYTI